MAASFRIHYLVPNSAGKIISDGGPMLPVDVSPGQHIGKAGRYCAACDPNIVQDEAGLERFTDQPWAVQCNACKKTEVYKKDFKPRHAARADSGFAETEDNPCGCK